MVTLIAYQFLDISQLSNPSSPAYREGSPYLLASLIRVVNFVLTLCSPTNLVMPAIDSPWLPEQES